jgi:hypothetical protein
MLADGGHGIEPLALGILGRERVGLDLEEQETRQPSVSIMGDGAYHGCLIVDRSNFLVRKETGM